MIVDRSTDNWFYKKWLKWSYVFQFENDIRNKIQKATDFYKKYYIYWCDKVKLWINKSSILKQTTFHWIIVT